MSLEYWELKHAPSEGDTESWQLKLKIPASELISFLNNLPGIIGEPAKVDEADFNFRVFIYEVKPGIFPLITDYLKEKCPIGEIYDKTKRGAFESVLDALAESLDTLKGLNDGKEKTEEAKPEGNGSKEHGVVKPIKEHPETQNDEVLSYKDISDIFNVNYSPQYTFSSYTAGKAQESAIETIVSVANNPGTAHNPVFIQSGPGTGKTHLLHAIAQQARSANNSLNIYFIDPELFIAKMSNSFKDGSLFYAKRYFLRSDILLVDNIELFKESVIYQKQIASIFRYLLELKKQIVITSRCAKEELSFLDSKLFELVSASFTVKIGELDNETRLDIFKKLLRASNIRIDTPQTAYISSKLPANFHSMEAFIKRLKLYTSIKNDALSNEILDKALSETVSSSAAVAASSEPAPVVSVQATMPKPAPVAEPAPDQVSTPVSVPKPVELKPISAPVAASEPVAVPVPEPSPEPAPVDVPLNPPVSEPVAVPSPVAEPTPVNVPFTPPVSVSAPIPVPEPVSAPEPVAVPEPAPVNIPFTPPIAAPIPVAEPVSVPKPVAAEPIAAPITASEPVAVPVPIPVPEPAPVNVPFTPPISAPVAVPAPVPAAPPVPIPPQPQVAACEMRQEITPIPAKNTESVVSSDATIKITPQPPAPQVQAAKDKKAVKVGLFYPAGYYIEAVSLKDNFRNCLVSHKFNFALDFVFSQQYTSSDSPKFKIFSDICVRNDVQTAIVLGFLKSNLGSSNIPSLEEIKMHLAMDPANKCVFFEFIDNKIAGADKSCLQYVLDISIARGLK